MIGRLAGTASRSIGQNLSIRRPIKPARRPNRPARRPQGPGVGLICSARGTFLADGGPNCPADGLVRSDRRAMRPAGEPILSAVGKIRAARRLFRAAGQQRGPANGALAQVRRRRGPARSGAQVVSRPARDSDGRCGARSGRPGLRRRLPGRGCGRRP